MVSTTVQEIIQCRRGGATTLQLQLDHSCTSSNHHSIDNHKFVRALTTLTQVRRVEIPLQPFYVTEPRWDYEQVADIMRAVGELELLESVTIQARTLQGNPFPVGLLTHILWPCRHRLRYLHIDAQRLQCLSRATRRLARALEEQTCLEWVKLKYCKILTNTSAAAAHHGRPQGEANDNDNNNQMERQETVDYGAINPILRSLAKLPALKHLQLVGTCEGEDNEFAFDDLDDEIFPTIDAPTLLQLLRWSRSLQDLRLEWLDLDAKAIGSLSAALRSPQSSCLQKLVVGLFPEDEGSFKVFAGMIHHNRTLKVVHVQTSWRTSEVSPLLNSIVRISNKTNNTTQSSMEKFLVLLGQALCYSADTAKTACLHEIHLCGPTIGNLSLKAEGALVTALQSNLVLTSLKIGTRDSREGEIGGDIEYYLKLNQLDRKHFIQQYERVTTEEWIAILARAECDLNSVFYFLRLNPFLCSPSTGNGSPPFTQTSSARFIPPTGLVDLDAFDSGDNALTLAVANMIETVATTMEIELQYRDERERQLEEEIQRLRMELASIQACQLGSS